MKTDGRSHLRFDDGHQSVSLADGGITSQNVGILEDGLVWRSVLVDLQDAAPLGKLAAVLLVLGATLVQIIQTWSDVIVLSTFPNSEPNRVVWVQLIRSNWLTNCCLLSPHSVLFLRCYWIDLFRCERFSGRARILFHIIPSHVSFHLNVINYITSLMIHCFSRLFACKYIHFFYKTCSGNCLCRNIYPFDILEKLCLPWVVHSSSEPNRLTTPWSTLIPGRIPRLLRISGNGVPSAAFWYRVSWKRITPEMFSATAASERNSSCGRERIRQKMPIQKKINTVRKLQMIMCLPLCKHVGFLQCFRLRYQQNACQWWLWTHLLRGYPFQVPQWHWQWSATLPGERQVGSWNR